MVPPTCLPGASALCFGVASTAAQVQCLSAAHIVLCALQAEEGPDASGALQALEHNVCTVLGPSPLLRGFCLAATAIRNVHFLPAAPLSHSFSGL